MFVTTLKCWQLWNVDNRFGMWATDSLWQVTNISVADFRQKYGTFVCNFKATLKYHSYLFVQFSHSDNFFVSFPVSKDFFKMFFDAQSDWKATWKLFSLKSFATYVGYSIAKSAKSVKFWNNLMDKPSKILPSLVDFSIFQVQGDSICVFREEFMDQKVFPIN